MKPSELVGERLRQARERIGLTQAQAASKCAMPLVSYKKYEQGRTIPGGESLIALSSLGINLDWLLTGDGEMLREDPHRESEPLDMERLAAVIGELEAALGRSRRLLAPERKARATAVLYDYFRKAGPQDAATVDRVLDLMT